MKSHPVLFSGDMVRAILEGRKTQTRRPVKQAMRFAELGVPAWQPSWCPLGVPGDELWVRETHAVRGNEDGHPVDINGQLCAPESALIMYRADTERGPYGASILPNGHQFFGPWTPSIHMSRWASRITLKVTDVRVQRLMDASEADIIAEGFTNSAGYQSAMMKAYGDGITYTNPWVWAVTFEVKP